MDWTEIKQWRKAKRNELLERRLSAPREARKEWAAQIQNYVSRILADMSPQLLGFYLPFKGEFDARPLVRELLETGWSAALPVVVDKKGPLEFRAWRPAIAMEPGVYDIPVPKERNVVTPTVLLVPVVGFDSANYRLGYGGGYYDRTLAAAAAADRRPFAIGVGFELSRIATIHPQPHDVPMDVIVTELRVIPRTAAAAGPGREEESSR